ncbi:MAG: V-type ATP synthase subunit F [Candidatus Thorarchaeota archaeon]
MMDQKIYVLGQEDLVILFGLLGIESKIINSKDQFIEEFNKLITNPSIGMIVIAMPLDDDEINLLLNFKLSNKNPFIFILPDVFQPNIEEKGKIVNKILEAIREIVLS